MIGADHGDHHRGRRAGELAVVDDDLENILAGYDRGKCGVCGICAAEADRAFRRLRHDRPLIRQRRPFGIAALRPVQGNQLICRGGLIGSGVGNRWDIGKFKSAGIKGWRAVGVAVGGADPFDHKVSFEDRVVGRIEAQGARVHADVNGE